MRLSIVGQRAAATLRGDRGRIRPLESRHHSELHDCACGGGPQGHVGPIVVASITPDAAPGLVASLARPGGNVTASRHRTLMSPAGGSSCCAKSCPTCAGWRTDYVYAMEMDVLQAAARTFGLETVTLKDPARRRYYACIRGVKGAVRQPRAARVREPSSHQYAAGDSGCLRCTAFASTSTPAALMSYGANIPEMFRRCADYVDKILRGDRYRAPAAMADPVGAGTSTSRSDRQVGGPLQVVELTLSDRTRGGLRLGSDVLAG